MIKTGKELAAAAESAAKKHRTLYIRGCFGAPMNGSNKERYTNNLAFNKQASRKSKILAAGADVFGFDCVCFIKALLWGWVGNTAHEYGGATYQSNGVPDINADSMIAVCKEVSTDFSKIQPGEAVWIPGHIGIYIGKGLVAECTHIWADGVQITAVHNIGTKSGYNGRTWNKHGKIPYVEYSVETVEKPAAPSKLLLNLAMPTLRNGSNGETVRALQILLIGNGCSCGNYGADGKFGTATENAVMMYQDKNGLTVDGICGSKTWAKLLGV